MKICVLVKQVPDKDSDIKVENNENKISNQNLNFITNDSDNYAVEEALLLKEKHGGEVVICTFGEESATQVIKDSLSKGADRGIFIHNDLNKEFDILNISKIIKNVIEKENFDLILSGLQSDDIGNGQLGVLLAEHLNMSHGSLVMETKMDSTEKIKVKRELENGWFQWATLDLPASITIQSGINKPRYASLRGIMMMKRKTIDTVKLTELNAAIDEQLTLKELYAPIKSKKTEKINGSSQEIADRIFTILKEDLMLL
jgi:electron transfer flavoprotein beta subunit